MTAIFEKIAFYWTYPFVRYALIVGVLIALCSSLLGVSFPSSATGFPMWPSARWRLPPCWD